MDVVLEPDATPLVRIIATTLSHLARRSRTSRARPKACAACSRCSSAKDPQSVTMRFASGRVELTRGVAPDAQVVVTVDLDNMSGPDAAKPKVRGRASSSACSRSACRSCSTPKPRPWSEHAQDFWAFAGAPPGMPGATSRRVSRRRCGRSTLGEWRGHELALRDPRLRARPASRSSRGTRCSGRTCSRARSSRSDRSKHASVLTGAVIAWMMRGDRMTPDELAGLARRAPDHDGTHRGPVARRCGARQASQPRQVRTFAPARPCALGPRVRVGHRRFAATRLVGRVPSARARRRASAARSVDHRREPESAGHGERARRPRDDRRHAAAGVPARRAARRRRSARGARLHRDRRVRARVHVVPRVVRRSRDGARYRNLSPMGMPLPVGYTTHNAHYVVEFMDEVVRRLDGLGHPVGGVERRGRAGPDRAQLRPRRSHRPRPIACSAPSR